MNTEQPLRHEARAPLRTFAVPFLTVLGCYALGVFTFSVMAAANVPGGGDVAEVAWQALKTTNLFALAAALAAGRWWV